MPPGRAARGVEVHAAGGEVAGAGPRLVVRVQPRLAQVAHGLGVAEGPVALGQAQVGRGALGGGGHGAVGGLHVAVAAVLLAGLQRARLPPR